MLQVVGVQEVRGEYEGRPYHNYRIHCFDGNAKGVVGNAVTFFSIKAVRFENVLQLYKGKLEDFIGAGIEVYYDQYRRPLKVDIVG